MKVSLDITSQTSKVELHALRRRNSADRTRGLDRRALLAEAHVAARLQHHALILVKAHAAQLAVVVRGRASQALACLNLGGELLGG